MPFVRSLTFGVAFRFAVIRAILVLSLGLATTKFVATISGPSAFGDFVQWQSLLLFMGAVAASPAASALVRYGSMASSELSQYFVAAVMAGLLYFCLLAFVSLFLWDPIVHAMGLVTVDGSDSGGLIMFMAGALLLTAFQSIDNVCGSLGPLTASAVLSQVGAFAAVILAYFKDGEAQDLTEYLFLAPFFALVAMSPHYMKVVQQRGLIEEFKVDTAKLYLIMKFSVAPVLSLFASIGIFLTLRASAYSFMSDAEVGVWSGAKKLSDAYMSGIILVMTTYYLPLMSKADEIYAIKVKMLQFARQFLLSAVVFFFILLLVKDFIVLTLFSASFQGMGQLIVLYAIGDLLKCCAFVFSYFFLARAFVLLTVVLEIVFAVLIYYMGVHFAQSYGVVGLGYSHILTYLTYLVICATVFYFYTKDQKRYWNGG